MRSVFERDLAPILLHAANQRRASKRRVTHQSSCGCGGLGGCRRRPMVGLKTGGSSIGSSQQSFVTCDVHQNGSRVAVLSDCGWKGSLIQMARLETWNGATRPSCHLNSTRDGSGHKTEMSRLALPTCKVGMPTIRVVPDDAEPYPPCRRDVRWIYAIEA